MDRFDLLCVHRCVPDHTQMATKVSILLLHTAVGLRVIKTSCRESFKGNSVFTETGPTSIYYVQFIHVGEDS